MSKSTSKVPMGQKIAFGFGMLTNQMFPAALGIFMVVLVQNLGFPGWLWGSFIFFLEYLIPLQIQLWDLYQIIQNLNGVDEDNMFLSERYLWGYPLLSCGNYIRTVV